MSVLDDLTNMEALLGAAAAILVFGGGYLAYKDEQKKKALRAIEGATETSVPMVTKEQISGLITLMIFGAMVWYFWGGGLENSTAREMTRINTRVADDAIAQYNIAKSGGDKMDKCVHAGLVAAAYIQAKDQANYNWWKQVESGDCAAAGLRR